METNSHTLAGSAPQSTREIVQVLSVEGELLEPCLLTKARRFVEGGRALWIELDRSIRLVSKRTPGSDEWRWQDSIFEARPKAPAVFYPRENRLVELPGEDLTGDHLVKRRLQVFHRAGRNGRPGRYLCTRAEFAFLIESGAIELRDGRWFLTFCPGYFKFLRRTNRN